MREAGEMIFVDVCVTDTGETADLRIPRDIPVCALAKALSARFKLGIPDGLAGTIALRTLWPQGLMAGSRPVGAFGVRDGTFNAVKALDFCVIHLLLEGFVWMFFIPFFEFLLFRKNNSISNAASKKFLCKLLIFAALAFLKKHLIEESYI